MYKIDKTNININIDSGSCTHIWNDDGEFGVQSVVHLPNGTFVTPKRIVVLGVFGVRVACRGEDLVPGCCVAVRLWNAVRRLPEGGVGGCGGVD